MARPPRFRLLAIGFLCLASVAFAFDETRDSWIRGVFTGNSPRAVTCAESEAWRDAIEVVSQNPGSFILVGTGRSMLPLYPAGTLLVIRETEYSALRSGQTVIYRNERQRAVGHVLVAKAREGWRSRGLNNTTHDREPVTETKLIGVVIAAYTPQDNVAAPAKVASRTTRRPVRQATFQSENGR